MLKKLAFVLGLLAMSANADMLNTSVSPSNHTLTCAARNIQGPVELPFLPELLPFVVRCVLILLYMYVCFFGVALNIWTPYLVWKFKSLRNMSFSFAVQVSILNIIDCLTIIFSSMVTAMANEWLLGAPMCILLGAMDTVAANLRALLMLILVLDRFCLVFMPYWYPRNRSKIMYTLLPIGYAISVVPSITLGLLDCFSFSSIAWQCEWTDSCGHICAVLRWVFGLTFILPPRIPPSILYLALHWKARKSRRQTPTTQDISTEDSQESKKEWRATITFSLLFLSNFVLLIVPVILYIIVDSIAQATDSRESVWVYLAKTATLNVFSMLRVTDAIFILRNRDIKDALAKVEWLPPFWYTCSCKDEAPPERR